MAAPTLDTTRSRQGAVARAHPPGSRRRAPDHLVWLAPGESYEGSWGFRYVAA